MNVLITGSRGFIGSNLINSLNINNNISNIYVLDRSNDSNLKLDNIKNIRLSNLDTCNIKFDSIIHLASKAHINNFLVEDLEYNFNLAKKLILFSTLHNISKFIYISTIKVYGETNINDLSFSEKHEPSPKCLYSKSKYKIEKEIVKFFTDSMTNFYILRIPLVIGNGAKGNLEILIKYILKGIPLPLKYSNNKRSFISLTNLIYSIQALILKNNVDSGIFNLCDSKPISTLELVREIKAKLNSRSIIFPLNKYVIKFIFFVFGRADDYFKIFLSQTMDNSKSKNNFIWNEVISTKEEINNMVKKYKK